MEIRGSAAEACRLERAGVRFERARLIEKCAAYFEKRLQLNFDLLAEVGEWNRANAETISLEEVHTYCRKLAELLQKARTFTL
jgi:hypothetical protein